MFNWVVFDRNSELLATDLVEFGTFGYFSNDTIDFTLIKRQPDIETGFQQALEMVLGVLTQL